METGIGIAEIFKQEQDIVEPNNPEGCTRKSLETALRFVWLRCFMVNRNKAL